VTVLGKYTVYSFDNPYLDAEEGENRYSAAVIMDEARERWRTGNWRAKRESFHLSRKEIAGKKSGGSKPSSARFRLDIRKDLMGETISLKKLSELDYSASYRPQGNLDEHLVTPMSTMQRYDVLAGDLESPPEDLSFLTDADSRLRRELEKSGNKKDGSLRRDTRRLEKSLDERRAALIGMLPDADTAEARQIVRESQRAKQRMDAEIGRLPKDPDQEKKEKEKKKKRKIYAVPLARGEEPLPELRDLSVLRSSRMPRQYGLDAERAELPEFESETRHWSRITSESPSWSEVQQHTEHISPSDLEEEPETRRAHYVDDVEYDPEQPFRPVFGIAPRERLYSEEVGQYENEYNRQNGISADRIREIMEKEYRGRWIPPEYYSDDRLVNAWFNDLNRGVLEGEDFLDWAYRRRMEAAEARRAAEEHRRRSREAQRARNNRAAPRSRADRRQDNRARYERALEMGYRQGRELADRDRHSRRDGEYHGMYPDLFEDRGRRDAPPRERYDERYDRRYDDRYYDDGYFDDLYDDRYDDRYDRQGEGRGYDRRDRYDDRRRSRRYDD